MFQVAVVGEADLDELLPLMRAYCDFYGARPEDADLLTLARALISAPDVEGFQLIARDSEEAVGFTTVFFSWSTVSAGRIAIMNDLFVHPAARGAGLAERLIFECVEHCRRRGNILRLGWQTAKDNKRAQAVYERIGAQRQEWIDYSIVLE